jgi:hypothetical protein
MTSGDCKKKFLFFLNLTRNQNVASRNSKAQLDKNY